MVDTEARKAFASYIYLIITGTEILKGQELYKLTKIPKNTDFNNNMISPIGPGIATLALNQNANFTFNNSKKYLVQLFGHKPTGITTCCFSVPKRNQILINIDISNSFTSDHDLNDGMRGPKKSENFVTLNSNGTIESDTYIKIRDDETKFERHTLENIKSKIIKILEKKEDSIKNLNIFSSLEESVLEYDFKLSIEDMKDIDKKTGIHLVPVAPVVPDMPTKSIMLFYNGICILNTEHYHCYTVLGKSSYDKIIVLLKEDELTQPNIVDFFALFPSIEIDAFKKKYIKYKLKYLKLAEMLKL